MQPLKNQLYKAQLFPFSGKKEYYFIQTENLPHVAFKVRIKISFNLTGLH